MSECNPKITPAEHERLMTQMPWLHVYGQPAWHSDCEIIGNRIALENLRAAIDAVLRGGVDGRAEAMVADGEGYHVVVQIRDHAYLAQQRLPYTADYASGKT